MDDEKGLPPAASHGERFDAREQAIDGLLMHRADDSASAVRKCASSPVDKTSQSDASGRVGRPSSGEKMNRTLRIAASVRCSKRGDWWRYSASIRDRFPLQRPLRLATIVALVLAVHVVTLCDAEVPERTGHAHERLWSSALAPDLRAKYASSWPYPRIGNGVGLREVGCLSCCGVALRSHVADKHAPGTTNRKLYGRSEQALGGVAQVASPGPMPRL